MSIRTAGQESIATNAAAAAPDELDALARELDMPETQASPPAEPEPPAMPTSALIAPALAVVFRHAAPAWRVSDAEIASLAEAYGALVDKYFPGGLLNRWGIEVAALMATLAVLGPRWGTPTHEVPKQEEARAA